MVERLIALPQVKVLTGMSRSSIYSYIDAGTFPAPAKVGSASRWAETEIEKWIAKKLAARSQNRSSRAQFTAGPRRDLQIR